MKKIISTVLICVLAGVLSFGAVSAQEEKQTETGKTGLGQAIGSLAGKVMKTNEKECYNLLLIGVDRRDKSWNGNADVMILVTVNKETQNVILTSFMRDLYADVPGIGVRKLNAACANGGGKLCEETISENYGVDIDNYAMVDFNSMITLIDEIGGVDLDIPENEISVCNDYIKCMADANDEDPEEHYFTEAGEQHLDGYQAVAYCRNRYSKNEISGNANDFGRTDRQRDVLEAVLEKVKSDDAQGPMAELAMKIMPCIVEHDMDTIAITSLLTQAEKWLDYNVKQQRIPYDDMYYSQNEILTPTDMEATRERIHTFLYEE